MADLTKHLQNKLNGARRVAILGIGSEYRQDDAAGMLVASYIDRGIGKGPLRRRIKVFYGGTAPETGAPDAAAVPGADSAVSWPEAAVSGTEAVAKKEV